MTNPITIENELERMTKPELNKLIKKAKGEQQKTQELAVNEARRLVTEGYINTPFDEGIMYNPNLAQELADAKAAAKAEKKAKKAAEKPQIDYDWQSSQYEGRQVYALGHTVRILQESADKQYFLVQLPNGDERPAKQSSVRFEAVNGTYRDRYEVDRSVRTASGSPSISNGSDLAHALKGLGLNSLGEIAKENDVLERFQGWMDAGRNPGMVRMNLGNVLAARLKRGEKVIILGEGNLQSAAQAGKRRAKELAEQQAAAQKEKNEAKKAAEAERQAKKEAKAAEKAKAKEDKAKASEAKAETKKADKAKAKKAA